MTEQLYVISLTDGQAAELTKFLEDKRWPQKLTTYRRHEEMKHAVEDYTFLKQPATPPTTRGLNGENTSPVLGRSRIQSLPVMHIEETMATSGDMSTMRRIGSQYKTSFKGSSLRGSVKQSNGHVNGDSCQGEWRKSCVGTTLGDINTESDIAFDHYLVADDKAITVVTKLSTEHVTSVSRVPVRIVLLVDKSGSMWHKIGKDSKHAKITKVKHFAKQLIQTLDDGDEVAMVTFGEEAEVFFPLEKLNDSNRSVLQSQLNKLDYGSMSHVTNLSAGLRMALKVYYDSMKDATDYLESKNSILIFSDGEINAGTTDTQKLLHEVRQNIRQMVPGLDETQNQWVTISVVTTGSNVSEQAYMLSKTCSSEAYYYINKDAEDTEAELFVPVLLRKTAVAWNISYVIESFQDIAFDSDKCTKDNRVRLRRSISGKGPKSERAYFMYDFAAGHTRQVGICANWDGETSIQHLCATEPIFRLRVEYTSINGERFWQEQTITKDDLLDALHQTKVDGVAGAAAYKHELQIVSCDILRAAAEHVKSGDTAKSKEVMQDGQTSLKALMEGYGQKASEATSSESSAVLTQYAKCVVDNLGALISTVEESTNGESWNKMKAVSTAIVRETPNLTNTVVDADVLCPFPDIEHMETSAMRDPLERLMAKNKQHKRITFGLGPLLEEQLANA